MKAFALRVLALVALIAAVSAQNVLPLLTTLPTGCGSVRIVETGDTCASVAGASGISKAEFISLNPLLLCGVIPLTVGAPVCTGNVLSFCNNPVKATGSDTCDSLNGTVVGLPAGQTCATLASTSSAVPVCVAPVNQCANDTICGVPISSDLQTQLGSVPDYCSIISSCEGSLATGAFAGKNSLVLTLSSASPSVKAVVGNDGHPELSTFVSSLSAGSASLEVTFTPGFYSDGSSSITFSGTSTTASRRKLLGYIYRGGTRVPWYYYYGR